MILSSTYNIPVFPVVPYSYQNFCLEELVQGRKEHFYKSQQELSMNILLLADCHVEGVPADWNRVPIRVGKKSQIKP